MYKFFKNQSEADEAILGKIAQDDRHMTSY